MSAVADRVRQLVVEKLNVEASKVTDNARFVDDLGADSLDTVELVMEMEEKFGIVISDDDQAKIATVGDVIAFVEKGAVSASQE